MKQRALFVASTALVSALAVNGCGGGSSSPPPPPPANVTISGTARYDSVPFGSSLNAGLNYAATTQKPIRGAEVDILNSTGTTVLASTWTDAAGFYSASFATGGTISQAIVRVRAASTNSTAGPTWNFSVRDNTQNNGLYVLDTGLIALTMSAIGLDLRAASGWGGSSYTGPRAAAVFAILDAVYDAVTTTAAVAPAQVWPELQICWSVNNVPTSGGAPGQIGTTFYAGPDPNTGIHQIFVLGAANVDTDEFDSHVIAHEWGHYFQNVVSRDDSTGGPHSSGDYLDLRIAFSEGWGNAWSGIALGDPIYRDSGGASQQSGFAFDVSSAPASAPIGWYGEDTNQYLIYTLDQQLGLGPIFQAMSGAVRTNLAASSMFSFASALKGVVTPTNAAAVDAVLLTQNVHVADAFGSTETNNGGSADALPIYKLFGPATPLCVNNLRGTPNKLANIAYAIVTIPTTGNHTITVSGGTDPDYEIFNATYYNFSNGSVAGVETQTFNLAAADYIVAVTEYSFAMSQVCLTLTVN